MDFIKLCCVLWLLLLQREEEEVEALNKRNGNRIKQNTRSHKTTFYVQSSELYNPLSIKQQRQTIADADTEKPWTEKRPGTRYLVGYVPAYDT